MHNNIFIINDNNNKNISLKFIFNPHLIKIVFFQYT